MCFLRALGVGGVLPGTGVFRTEVVADESFCSASCQRRKVGGVRTHVGDETPFVQGLCQPHGGAYGQMQFARSLLLQGRGGKRSCRNPDSVFLLYIFYCKACADAVLQELFCLLEGVELVVKDCFNLYGRLCAFGVEGSLDAIERLFLEGHDLPFPVDD